MKIIYIKFFEKWTLPNSTKQWLQLIRITRTKMMISMRVINLKSISNKLNSQMEDDEELSESESDYDSVRTGDMSNEDEMIEEEAF